MANKTAGPETPELDKQSQVRDQSQIIGEFLEWLDTQEIVLATYDRRRMVDDRLTPIGFSIEQLLADYYNIDLDKIEQERRAILEDFRKRSTA